ncbi:hypothetical protein ABPG73_000530 [Tetrahymena malaccensis]
MSNLTYLNNTANIHLTKVQNILIFNSEFINNTGINGGALFIQNNSIYFNISNSTFQGNLAKASGGAIYFKEQLGIINIDKFCSVKYNQAMIGGGLRIQNSNLYEYSSQLLNQVQLLDIRNNTADLFSQNYYLGLSRVDIISINSVSQDNLPIEFNFKQNLEQDLYSGQLNLLNLNSGDKLNITIGIMDEEKNFLEFNTNMFRNNQYQTDIQNELSQFSFSLQPIDQQQIQLEGQINIHSDSYESVIKSFVFNQISILGSPLGVGCQYCQIGSYSLQDYSNYNLSYINSQIIESSCNLCPQTADQCQGQIIKIKQGYWRISKHSDNIIQCVNNPLSCQEQEISSINGCVEGYVGPLCEECDIFGVVWQDRYSKKQLSQSNCIKCNPLAIQILYIFGIVVFIIVYGLISTILFMNSFIFTQSCYYVRQLQILPISKSSIKDYSSFYLKILVNYLQIMQYLMKLNINDLQQNISNIFDTFQSPQLQFQNLLDCLINSKVSNRIERIKVNHVIQALNPIIFSMLIALILLIFNKIQAFQVKKYHIYTMLNVMFIYFLPNSMTYFVNSFKCRQIGDRSMVQLDINIDCSNQDYQQFNVFFSNSKNYNSADQETNNCMMNIINQKSSDILDVKKEVESLESISTIFEKLNNKGYVKQLSDFLDHLIFEELNFTHAELQKIMMNLANQKNLNFNEQFQINCNIFKTCFFQIINIIVQKSWQKQYGALQLTSVPSIQQIQDKIENVSIHENQKNDCGGQQNLENEKSKEQQIKENNQKLDQYQIYKISNLSQLYKSDQLEQIISVGAISSEESVYQISQSKIQIDPAKESHQNTLSNTTNATAFESLSECKDSRRRTKSSINPKEYIRQLAKSDQKLSLLLNINEYDKTHMFKKILEKHKQNLVYSPNQQQTVRNSVMRSSFFSPSHSYNKKEDLFIINLSEFGQSNTKLKQSLSISERRSNVNQIKQTPSPCDYDVKKSEKFVRPNSPTQVFSKSPRQSWIDLQTKKEGAYQNQSQNKHDTKKSNLSVKKITSNYGVK